jgi:hypothetical protein
VMDKGNLPPEEWDVIEGNVLVTGKRGGHQSVKLCCRSVHGVVLVFVEKIQIFRLGLIPVVWIERVVVNNQRRSVLRKDHRQHAQSAYCDCIEY